MSKWGKFQGSVEALWLMHDGADRDMRVLKGVVYETPNKKRWEAPAGSVVNGASIPRLLWSVIGSPYVGDYRRASVVHDVACETPKVPRKAADRMFYYACRADGCGWLQAKVLYIGVRIGAWISGDQSLRHLSNAAPLGYGPVPVLTPEEHMVLEVYQRSYYLTEHLEGTDADLDAIDQTVKKSIALSLARYRAAQRQQDKLAKSAKKPKQAKQGSE